MKGTNMILREFGREDGDAGNSRDWRTQNARVYDATFILKYQSSTNPKPRPSIFKFSIYLIISVKLAGTCGKSFIVGIVFLNRIPQSYSSIVFLNRIPQSYSSIVYVQDLH
jgi:hypothetical protein